MSNLDPVTIDPIALKNPGKPAQLPPVSDLRDINKVFETMPSQINVYTRPPRHLDEQGKVYYLLESRMDALESAVKWGPIRSPDGQLYQDLYTWLQAVEAGEWGP